MFKKNYLFLIEVLSLLIIVFIKLINMGELGENINNLTIANKSEDIVNPWHVSSASDKGVDYDKLIRKSLIA